MIRKKTAGERIFDVINILVLAIVGILCLYPFLYVVLASFSDPNKFIRHDFFLLLKPEGFSLEAYTHVFTKDIATGYLNTLFYVAAGTTISMILTFLGAYVLSRKNYMFRKPLTLLILFTMYFNGGLIATYLWVQQLHILDTRWAILLPMALSTYNMIVLRSAFDSIPESLVEAAKIDGASELTCLTKIMIPLSKASTAVIVLFYAVSRWNDWMLPTIFLRTRELFPLQLFLREILLTGSAESLLNTSGSASNVTALAEIIKYATIVVSTVPILCVYPFVQKYFVTGMMIGGVKE